ncbi:ATP-binding protein [Desulfosporosinus sp. BG]|uniref:ATP-binding protein n=1 Tax=Desulfosporosinus sp. BG TaxID=1633135 RepID=UPI00083B17EC|nr:ATP-binding protein [Desulfosporosinus sp. BG]ODA42703.1 Bipolar DNA helicase HerA [Desulfosporosinus sp. BG]
MNRLIGRVLATEKTPTTMDKFNFWTDTNLQLHAFDIVKVEHIDKSFTFGVVENISHITDAQSFLTNFISSDFGDVELDEPTFRVGMNYAEAKVSFNSKNLYTPVHNNAKVYLASAEEITMALGLDKIQNPLVCGSLKMYEGTKDEVTLPVKLNSKFILGPDGAHLNISGISGLASKTSYAMFLMKAIQDQYLSMTDSSDSVAFVIFNVKGCDLMAIDRENDFAQDMPNAKEETLLEYKNLGLSPEPFKNVKYFIPYYDSNSAKKSTYLPKSDVDRYMEDGQLKKYKYVYSSDKESIEMMFSNIDDPAQTMESIISKIIDEDDPDFKGLSTWADFIDKVSENSLKGSGQKGSNDISVLSWRKFKRIVRKAIQDEMFANRVVPEKNECRLADELKKIRKNNVVVIDIAKLPEDKQAFVFGDAVRTIYNLKLGEYDAETDVAPPSRIIVFIDELNKYASKDVPKTSPILSELLNVTERGRSLGVVLFGAEQFRSAIHDRVTGNCATHAYGRTNSIEISTKNYGSLPNTYKNMLTRLEQGDYLIQNPVFRSLLKIRFPKPIYKQFK